MISHLKSPSLAQIMTLIIATTIAILSQLTVINNDQQLYQQFYQQLSPYSHYSQLSSHYSHYQPLFINHSQPTNGFSGAAFIPTTWRSEAALVGGLAQRDGGHHHRLVGSWLVTGVIMMDCLWLTLTKCRNGAHLEPTVVRKTGLEWLTFGDSGDVSFSNSNDCSDWKPQQVFRTETNVM